MLIKVLLVLNVINPIFAESLALSKLFDSLNQSSLILFTKYVPLESRGKGWKRLEVWPCGLFIVTVLPVINPCFSILNALCSCDTFVLALYGNVLLNTWLFVADIVNLVPESPRFESSV